MVLCDTEIKVALKNGQIIIDPVPHPDNISTAAVDLCLGNEFSRWKPSPVDGVTVTIDPSVSNFYAQFARSYLEAIPLDGDGTVTIQPRELILALTREHLELPEESRLAAWVEGRSSLARLGLGVHLTAPTVHAGFRGRITLEITNQGPFPIKLRPGLVICQLIFEQVFGTPSAEMTGIFQDQASVTGKPQA
jgi:dCTP deaminase